MNLTKLNASVYTVLILCFVFTLNFQAFAQQSDSSVNYLFDSSNETGYVASGVPTIVENGALKFTIGTSWTAKLNLTVDKNIFSKPVMKIRYKIGTIKATNTGLAVILKIDNIWNKKGVSGWRIYPTINLSTTEWQELTVDLTPLIKNWENSNGTSHGNIQEIEINIGTDAYSANEFYFDYIKMGENLNVEKVEVNPKAPNELLANTGVPVTGTPTISNFTVTKDGDSLAIDSVFLRDGLNLVVKLSSPIDLPRNVMKKPLIKISYNGNDAIKDGSNSMLTAFQKDLSYSFYAESMWRYWGKIENKYPLPYKKPWVSTNTIADGWDWSLPDFIKADDLACFDYKNTPNINTPVKTWCNNLSKSTVSWRELEPSPGDYRFDTLRNRIKNEMAGYDGVTVRLTGALWQYESADGNPIPSWIANMKAAPRWMDTMSIAKIRMGSNVENAVAINMDIMDPEYHSRYLKFIEELGKSGIPEMPELKVMIICYRSSSTGEEYGAYSAKNNTIEAQYSDAIVAQRNRERLQAWANAFGNNRHKLMYVGTDANAQIEYAGELGIGTRHGFIQMYNSYVHMPQFGMTINADRYVDIDENNAFIKSDLRFGDENENMGDESFFGWKQSFPYRYYVSSFRMLQQRRNYVMHDENTLNPELTWYVGLGLARRVEDTPDAFCMLSEYYISKSANEGNAGAIKNIERWIYQRDVPGYMTTPAMKVPTAKDQWYADIKKPYDFTARKGQKIGFDIDNKMFPAGEQEFAVKVSYCDSVAGTLILKYENANGIQTESIVTTGSDKVRTATFFIKSNLAPKYLKFDLELHSAEEVPVFFVRVIKTKETYTSVNTIRQTNNQVKVSPNPFNDLLKLEFDNQDITTYTITDLLGRSVAEGNTKKSITINTGSWKTGVYLLKTNNSNTYKLIKKSVY